MAEGSKRCAGLDSAQGTPCTHPPMTVQRNGQWYCWRHDPDRLRALAARMAHRQLEEAAGIVRLSAAQLQQIVAFGGMRRILAALTEHGLPTGGMRRDGRA